jgi:hypothetical protein
MQYCVSLTSINLSGLTKLNDISHSFMKDCTSLISIKCSQKLKEKLITYLHLSEKTIKYIITP